jgi:glucokinase
MKKKPAMGIDLGGTKIRAGLVDDKGNNIGPFVDVSTEAHRETKVVESHILKAVAGVLKQSNFKSSDLRGMGIGSPGPLDLESGVILDAPNLPSLHHYPLKKRMQEKFGIPVSVDNDGNCFVLGEALFGLKNQYPIVAGLTLGTGVGCGIVMHGRVFHGATGTAAEIWKTPFRDKTIEEMLSGRGLENIYASLSGNDKDARSICLDAEKADPQALEAWQDYGTCLGDALAWITNLLDPDAIVLGGSLSHGWKYFQATMMNTFRNHIHEAPRSHIQIFQSSLGDAAGYKGAAALCFIE